MSRDLIIGATAQISQYLPESIARVSSRSISPEVYDTSWESVYITFAEQRTRFSEDESFKDEFFRVNVDLTLGVIDRLKADRIVYFSTTELWNKCNGAIDHNTPYNFSQNYYTDSKHKATSILSQRENVVLLYPFNFNSIHRSKDYLFGKIVSSIVGREKVKVGNLDMHRELLHAKWVSNVALEAKQTQIIGSGTVHSVRNYISDVYRLAGLDFHEFVTETGEKNRHSNTTYLKSDRVLYDYESLLKDTVDDIQSSLGKRHNL